MLLTGLDNAIIVVFILFMVGISFFFTRKIKNMEGFYLAGRALPWSLVVGTLVATWYGAMGTIAMVEYGFIFGISIWFLWCFTSHLSRIPMALWVGPKVHMSTGITVPDLLKKMYGKGPAFIGAILMFIYCSQLNEVTAIGIIGETAWGLDALTVSGIIVGICVILTVFGGLFSVAVTDMILFFFMCTALSLVVPIAWGDVGGFEGLVAKISALDPSHLVDAGGVEGFFSPTGGTKPGTVIVLIMLSMLAYADPTFYQRFSAADSVKTARRGLLMSITIWVIFDVVIAMIAIITKAKYPDMNPGAAYVTLTLEYLPVGLRAAFIIGLLGSIVSTLDSYYLTGGTTLSNDIVGMFRKTPLSSKNMLILTRLGVIVMAIMGWLIATRFTMVLDSWIFLGGLYASAALVPIVCGLLWPFKRTYWGGMLSMIVGLVLVTYFNIFPAAVDPPLIAIPASFVAFLIGNMFGKNLNEGSAIKLEVKNV